MSLQNVPIVVRQQIPSVAPKVPQVRTPGHVHGSFWLHEPILQVSATHVPPEQTGVLPAHLVPHAPQLSVSVLRFLHEVPQQLLSPVQSAPDPHLQVPLSQVLPLVQAGSQAFATHVPSEQTGVLSVHLVPHAPQLSLSVLRLVQASPHRWRPAEQRQL